MKKPEPSLMRRVTREEMKLMDTIAMESYRIPGVVLMESAGRGVADEAADLLGEPEGKKVAVFCGTGHNGGDGFVAARYLTNWGADVSVYVCGRNGAEYLDPDSTTHLAVIRKMEVPVVEIKLNAHVRRHREAIAEHDLFIDALLGTGLSVNTGTVREPAGDLISLINELDKPVVSVDVPSGLDCNTGDILGACVKAQVTVTMALPKAGFFEKQGPEYVGRLVVADIGMPTPLMEKREGLYLHRKP